MIVRIIFAALELLNCEDIYIIFDEREEIIDASLGIFIE